MDLGIHFMNFTLTDGERAIPSTFGDLAQAADELGFERLTVMDHWFQMERIAPASDPMLEAYTALGYAAGITERMKLGTLVTGVTYRHPGLLAKTVATLDVLSKGRAFLGIGAAWYEREHRGLGVPFPTLGERFERLEETIRIAEQMWSDDDGPFVGAHHQLDETLCRPRPWNGRIPLLIGGGGERKTLRLVAKYADECNLFGAPPAEVSAKLDVLRRHCDEVGRSFDDIRVTVLFSVIEPAQDPETFLDAMRGYAAVGVSQVQVRNPTTDVVAWAERVAQTVIPAMAEL